MSSRARPRRIRRRLAVLVVLTAIGAAGSTTMAAFVATSSKGGNSIASGSVSITDNDSGTTLLTLAAAQPGETDSGCITVTFAGTLSSGVRLYGTTTGSGLDQYLNLRVTRGTHNPSDPGFDSCANFQADATNYIGTGNGVIYNGTLQGYADSYAAGLVDPLSGSPETWTNGEVHVYKVDVTLQNNSSALGLNATQTFTWESRNQ